MGYSQKIDRIGQGLVYVQYLLVDQASGEAPVPSLSARLTNRRVVLNGSATNWSAAPHYRAEQIQQYYGSLGMAN